ncbi:MAG: hypothetical protein Q7N87_03795 [Candidatus Uhrbacteria bacterium]|nr:hypothetical protein [Candidatus Uhrbacteria bacterium]
MKPLKIATCLRFTHKPVRRIWNTSHGFIRSSTSHLINFQRFHHRLTLKKLMLFFSCFGVGLFFVSPALAVNLLFESSTQKVSVGQEIEIQLILDTKQDEVNAIEGMFIYPSTLLELESVRDGGSMVSFWIEPPRAPPAVAGQMGFSGVMPGGIEDHHVFLFAVRFKALTQGSASTFLRDVQVLRHDGRGTPVEVSTSPLTILIHSAGVAPPPILPAFIDVTPPEPFTPQILRDPNVFDHHWFVAFATQDKGSGIDHYEIKESRDPKNGVWQSAVSPYLLQDQTRGSSVSVRAIDRAGNQRVEILPPTFDWITLVIWIIVGGLSLTAMMIFVKFILPTSRE